MTGKILRLLDKTVIDFGAIDKALVGGDMFFANNVDVSQFTQAALLIRVHAKTVPGTCKVTFNTYPSAPTTEEPGTIFRAAALVTSPVADIVAATPAPGLIVSFIPNNFAAGTGFPGTLDFAMKPTYQLAGGPFSVTISVDLSLKA